MKKLIDYKYGKHIVTGAAGLAVVAGIAVFCGLGENKGTTKDRAETSYQVAIPSAGIAVLFDDTKDCPTGIYPEEFSSGIADVLNGYYGNVNGNKLVGVEAVDRVMRYLPKPDDSEDAGNAAVNGSESEVTGEAKAAEEVKDEQQTAEAEEGSTDGQAEEAPIVSVVEGYTVLGVANVTNYLNVRETPDTEGELLGKLPMNAGCEILETLDGWYRISSGNVEGYVSAEFLLTGKEANERALEALAKVAHVNADMLMVREEPNTDCRILTRVAEGEELEVDAELEGWIKVNIDDVTGYVSADYVDVYNALPKGVTLRELSYGEGVSSTAVDLIEYAKQFLGNPYVYGGTSLTNGTDCSGFTMRVYEHFGYSLSRTSREQAYNGTRVSISDIKPGDLLFYSHGGTIGHVAIYIGDGQIIHASTERTGIIISNAFYTTPTCATRIIN